MKKYCKIYMQVINEEKNSMNQDKPSQADFMSGNLLMIEMCIVLTGQTLMCLYSILSLSLPQYKLLFDSCTAHINLRTFLPNSLINMNG